jgi:formamidopyrimidine-DNA glycosylase
MIELPEAVVLAGQINTSLRDKRIRMAVANQSPHKFAWYSGDPADYPHLLTGKTIRAAAAYGNHVEIYADDRTLAISTPMRYHAAGEKVPPKHQLWLEFDDRTAVSCTVQMWGVLLCLKEGQKSGLPDYEVAKQRPSPLSDLFDRAYFDSLFDEASGGLSAKAFLAAEQRIPGLGNGVLQDILWKSRIHPRRKMAELPDKAIEDMYGAVKSVLADMAARGGRDTERDLFGRPGGYKTILSKNTVGTPCPACGTSIKKEPYLGGSIYYCAGCQSLGG